MTEGRVTDYLMDFGLSRQEALIYARLVSGGKQTGYEIAKDTGISRSNTYMALAALVEKGAAYLVEESAKKYIPVQPDEFCGNHIRKLKEEKQWLTDNLPDCTDSCKGYITIDGEKNIRDKIINLIETAEERVYLSCSGNCLEQFRSYLEDAASSRKIVLITDVDFKLDGIVVYMTEPRGNQIGLISDSKYVLSGEYGKNSQNNCLYSERKNFVTLFKTALANEIALIKIRKGDK